MQRTGLSIFCFLIFGLAISSTTLNARDSAASAIALSGELNKLGMFELSFYLLDKEAKNSPTARDRINVQKAQTFFAMKKDADGMKMLNSISSASPAYTFSRLVLGKHLWKSRKFKDAAAQLERYFVKIKSNLPKPNEKFRIHEFREAVAYLADCYKQLGKSKEAVTTMEKLKWISASNDDMTPKMKKFENIIFAATVQLDIAEQMKNEGKEGWKKDAESASKALDTILDDPDDPTLFTILAANEKLKACVLLEKFDNAQELIETYKTMTRSLDPNYEKERILYEAPSAKMYLWIAEYNYALAQKEEDKAKRIELNTKAITDFYRIITTYDNKLCAVIPAAAKGFNKAKAALMKDGKKVEARVKIPVNFDLERVHALYAKKEYAKVIPAILKILRAPGGKNSKNTPDLVSKLIDCYMKTNKMIEAITLAGFLGDCFPDSPNAPIFLLQLGGLKWKEAEKKKGTPEGEQAKKESLIIYGWYTKDCPTHKYAADISAKIAMEDYQKAADFAKKVNEMPNSEEKLQANIKARQGFLTVIPKLQHIVDNYSHTKRGKEAAFIIGNCYSNAYKFIEGSDTFAKYCDLETNNPKKNERLMSRVADAKFRMADNYVKYAGSINKEIEPLLKQREAAPETAEEGSKVKTKADIQKIIDAKKAKANKYFNLAIANFKELTDKWMQKGGRLYGLTKAADKKKVKDLYDKTIAYIPWVYDAAGDVDKTIAAFTEFLTKFPEHKSVPNALKRRAFKYIEKGETAKAAQDFATLSSKFPDKAKEIQPELARAMYETKKYDKSIEAVAKMFEGNTSEISVRNLRWIATNLSDCGGKHPKEGAALALKAVELLLKKLKEPVLADWVRKAKVADLEADTTKREATLKVIRDQILLIGTTAAYWSENYKTALTYLNDILSNPKTPYFYMAHFKRAEVYNKLKQYSKALKDYGEISNSLLGDKNAPTSMNYKTQVLVAMTFIRKGELGKALAGMGGVVMTAMAMDKELAAFSQQKKESEAEKKLQSKYTEDALFLSAACQNKLGDQEKTQAIVEAYRKLYPGGRYKQFMSTLPPPEKAVEKIKINIEE